MTAAVSTPQALIWVWSRSGSGEVSARVAVVAAMPRAVGHRAARTPDRPVRRVSAADGVAGLVVVVVVIGAPSSVLDLHKTLGAGRRAHAGKIARFSAGCPAAGSPPNRGGIRIVPATSSRRSAPNHRSRAVLMEKRPIAAR